MILEIVDQRRDGAVCPLSEELLGQLVAPLGVADWTLNLVLVDDRQMAALNERWYGGKGPTDVLSFSYLEEATAGEAPELAKDAAGAAADLSLPGDGSRLAGDVVVAPGFVAARAHREGWDLAAEWALLVVHGALHVLGWGHDDEAAARAMRAREAVELARRGFTHPLLTEGREA